MPVLACVPVKRFFVAKRRLAGVLSAADRSRLGRDLAAHTLEVASAAGAEALVLAADEEVAGWASRLGFAAVLDANGGLDTAAAAATGRAAASGRPWMILHADLPLLRTSDLESALGLLAEGIDVIAPSNDGGTSLVGANRPIRFAYGPGSFHRHLRQLQDPAVIVRLALCLDLDDSTDLGTARRHARGKWLDRYPALS